MQLDVGNEPYLSKQSNNTMPISWHEFFSECSKYEVQQMDTYCGKVSDS